MSNKNKKYRQLNPWKNRRGYSLVSLYKEKKQQKYLLHRLIAIVFLPNPEGKPQINHKNGIKTDNNLENLEWSTNYENTQHAHNMGLVNYGYLEKPVKQICKDTGKVLSTFKSAKSAEVRTGISRSNIAAVIKGKRKTTGGYKWQYS